MPIILAGVSHHRTPLELRERLYFADEDIGETLSLLARYNGLEERVLISTCNRVEIYSYAKSFDAGVSAIQDFLSATRGVAHEELRKHLYVCRDEEAVRHLFLVASSLDSMVVGEPQILGQVKDAFRVATEGGHAGKTLSELFSQAFRVAKRVRERTELGRSAVSVSSVATELAEKIFGTLRKRTILLLGAGEMGELAARHLVSRGADTLLVANRTFSRGEALAEKLDGRAVPYENLQNEMAGADILIASTGAPNIVVTREMVATALKRRRDAPIFLIDIAVPRDVDHSVNDLENVFLYDIDDLQAVVADNMRGREEEAHAARRIVEQEMQNFLRRRQLGGLSHTFASIRVEAETRRQEELNRTFSRLSHLGENDRRTIDAMTRALVNKLLHRPFAELREMAAQDIDEEAIALVQRLFGVEPPHLDQEADSTESSPDG